MSFILLLLILVATACSTFALRYFALDYFLKSELCEAVSYTINAGDLEDNIEYIVRCLEHRHRRRKSYSALIYINCEENIEIKTICDMLNEKYGNIKVM